MTGRRLRTRLLSQLTKSESGQSLVLAMIVMSALTISIGALVSFTTGNEAQFSRDRDSSRAFHAAEAGVNNALSIIVNNDDDDVQPVYTTLGPYPISGDQTCSPATCNVDGAKGTYTLKKYASTDPECTQTAGTASSCWVITGTATSPNGKIRRTIQETAHWVMANNTVPEVFNYGLVVDNQGGSCAKVHGSVPMVIKDVWISGDLCPDGGVSLMPPAPHTGSVYIGGVFQGTNGSSIGSSSTPYASADIVAGCQVQNTSQICSDSANSNVWADAPPSVDPSDLSLPSINPKQNYDKGNWSSPQCAPGGSFTFDSDSTPNGTTPTTTLMPSGASFDCTVNGPDGSPVGHLGWNAATKQLSISGTIWIDGNVDLSNSGTYVKDSVVPGANGGTIFINGTVSGAGTLTICGPSGSAVPTGAGCLTTWDPTQGMLGMVVVNPNNASIAFQRNGNGELDLTLLVSQGYSDTGGTTVMGPVMADTADVGGNGGSIVPSAPPTGFPNTTVTQATWVVQPGSWKQIQ
jgi:Tfp pilus assembly protein PilX